jgi:hypothetical protein
MPIIRHDTLAMVSVSEIMHSASLSIAGRRSLPFSNTCELRVALQVCPLGYPEELAIFWDIMLPEVNVLPTRDPILISYSSHSFRLGNHHSSRLMVDKTSLSPPHHSLPLIKPNITTTFSFCKQAEKYLVHHKKFDAISELTKFF